MKVTDLNVVNAICAEYLGNEGGEILEFLTIDDAAMCMALIYLTNDQMAEFTQHWTANITITSSSNTIVCVGFGRIIKTEIADPICKYVRLSDDIVSINNALNDALIKWEVFTDNNSCA